MNELLFADARVRELSSDHTLPAKFHRLLKRPDLESMVKGRSVAIKMHLGGNLGYTTVHPLFVRILVEECRQAGARGVAVMDGSVAGAQARGYTPEVVGAPIVSCFGWTGNYVYKRKIGFGELKEAIYGGNAWDAEVFIDLSRVKGHGNCGFGGAIKNIGMGCVLGKTRGAVHHLAGGIIWDGEKCIHCGKCIEECPNDVDSFDEQGTYNVNWHNCTFCQHCVMICPKEALTPDADRFDAMQEGLRINAAARNGSVAVAVLDEHGIQHEGYGRVDCALFDGDSVRHEVTWREVSFASLKGKVVRLKFYLRNARLYSFVLC